MKLNLKVKMQNSKLRSETRYKNFKICNLQSAICNSRSAGFTIVELMVSVVILAITIGSVYTTYIAQQRSFTTQDQLSETQTESKIAFNILVNDLRNAGFAYPATSNPTINGFTDSIVPAENNNAKRDALTLVHGATQIATLAQKLVIGQKVMRVTYTGAEKFNLTDKSSLSIDGIDFSIVTNCTPIVNDCDDSFDLQLNRGMSKQIPAGRPVYVLQASTYCIVTTPGDNYLDLRKITGLATPSTCSGALTSDTDRVAENIEDIQFAYAIDTDSDGEIEDQNANGVFDPGDYLTPPLPANSEILAVRVSILAVTTGDDPSIDPASKPYYSSGITLENNTTADNDRLRRKIWSMEVALRNPR